MSAVYRALAPAKVNLGLFVGPVRPVDGRHELATVMQSISLADELTLMPAGGGRRDPRDVVVCPGVEGDPDENLAALALRAFRERSGWDAPPQRLEIVKRIPVAAGLAGGSADAAAALRLAARASGVDDAELLDEVARELGADVPAQVAPGRWLATGAGERLRALAPSSSKLGVLVVALASELSTAAVYRELDRSDAARTLEEVRARELEMRAALEGGATLPDDPALLHNDLQGPAVSLCPPIAGELKRVREAGADLALVSGSGPTVLGLFAGTRAGGQDGEARARAAAATLAARRPAPIVATAAGAQFADVERVGEDARPHRA